MNKFEKLFSETIFESGSFTKTKCQVGIKPRSIPSYFSELQLVQVIIYLRRFKLVVIFDSKIYL